MSQGLSQHEVPPQPERSGVVGSTQPVRSVAEALAARAIREQKNIGALVTEILEAAAKRGA